MIVVTGGSGTVGGSLVSRLVERGQTVRAMTRRPDALWVPPGVEVVAGDADDPASLDAAFDGADRAFLMSAQSVGGVEGPTHDRRLVEAARRAGVRHVVKLSVYSGGSGNDVLARWHGQVEEAVTSSGLAWTLLRPGRFFSNALGWAPMLRRGDSVHVPFAWRPAAGIDPADIAAVAAVALGSEDLRGAALQLTGPEVLTPVQEVAALGQALGRALQVVEMPDTAAREAMITHGGMAPEVADAVLARVGEGVEGTEVLSTVADVLGRPPATFAAWAAAHAGAFA